MSVIVSNMALAWKVGSGPYKTGKKRLQKVSQDRIQQLFRYQLKGAMICRATHNYTFDDPLSLLR